jgi:methionyl-tRNA formyltransferase
MSKEIGICEEGNIKRTIAIAGKNTIAVEILNFVLDSFAETTNVVVVCNQAESGQDGWQKSLRLAACRRNVPECSLDYLFTVPNLLFLSLEFDQLVRPDKFVSDELYNIHFSLLPQYRGMYTSALPILKRESYSGVTLHRIDRGIDTGEIIAQVKFELEKDETAKSLYGKYIREGISLVKRKLRTLIFTPKEVLSFPQKANEATYYSKKSIDYSNLCIDLNQTAYSINCQIRAFSFREYQMPQVHGRRVISSRVTRRKSNCKPGTLLLDSDIGFIISTQDYDLILYYDRFEYLMEACFEGRLDTVKEICTVREHVNENDSIGRTPVMVATANGHMDIVKYLVCCGATGEYLI